MKKLFFILIITFLSSNAAYASQNWLASCMKAKGGSSFADARCYVEYLDRLQNQQAVILKRIRISLSKTGPDGTDYKAAAVLLKASQRNWLAYINSDCQIVDHVFGFGTAQGAAGESCLIEHYEIRNNDLKDLEKSYLTQ
jgi:uncharacterized protein YecT (DUF1311 family)